MRHAVKWVLQWAHWGKIRCMHGLTEWLGSAENCLAWGRSAHRTSSIDCLPFDVVILYENAPYAASARSVGLRPAIHMMWDVVLTY